MKTFSPNWKALLVLIIGLASVSLEVRAADSVVGVELLGDAPSGDLVASFDGPEADGLGWHREAEQFQDIGISFRAAADGTLKSIAFRLEKAVDDFSEEIPFRLEVYENVGDGGTPTEGKKVYEGGGKLAVRKSDIGMYPTFTLSQPVALQSGNFYTVVLIWESLAPVIVFQANPAYLEGFAWIRNDKTDGKFEPVTSSGRPGLTFFAQ